jgi:NTE family protein
LRKRVLIDNFKEIDSEGKPIKYGGTYWGIATQIDDYELEDAMLKDNRITASLKNIRTRLNRFTPEEQGRLINWGYALADTALRRWYFKDRRDKGEWPVPEYALDKIN